MWCLKKKCSIHVSIETHVIFTLIDTFYNMKYSSTFLDIFTVFRGLLGTEESPTKVLEVRSDNYLSRPIHYRKDSILLYGPKLPPDSKNPRDKYYEIVLHKPFTESLHQMYRSVGHRYFLIFVLTLFKPF